jgi:archaellum component FlaC
MDQQQRDTLIRIEQQLKDSVQNQIQVIEDIRTVFNRLERESKIIASLKAELRSHLDTTPIRKLESDNRIRYIEERHSELKESFNKFKDESRSKNSDSLINELDKLDKEFLTFKTEIKTSLVITRWIFGVAITLVTVILTILNIYGKLKGM